MTRYGVLGPDVLREPPDHHRELTLVVDALADRQQRDRVVGPDHGGRGLQEQQRFLGHRHAELRRVRGVVLADADELRRQHRREQVQTSSSASSSPVGSGSSKNVPASTRTVSSRVSATPVAMRSPWRKRSSRMAPRGYRASPAAADASVADRPESHEQKDHDGGLEEGADSEPCSPTEEPPTNVAPTWRQ